MYLIDAWVLQRGPVFKWIFFSLNTKWKLITKQKQQILRAHKAKKIIYEIIMTINGIIGQIETKNSNSIINPMQWCNIILLDYHFFAVWARNYKNDWKWKIRFISDNNKNLPEILTIIHCFLCVTYKQWKFQIQEKKSLYVSFSFNIVAFVIFPSLLVHL